VADDKATTAQDRFLYLLRQVRLDAGLTQAELASRLKMPQSFVSKYESGERRLDILELRHICKVTGTKLEKFARRLEALLDEA
jgi:transcriptional regulator with XRE-family HTH domain